MASLDLNLVRWSSNKIFLYRKEKNVQRGHLIDLTEVSRAVYDRIRNAKYEEEGFDTWRSDLWTMLEGINFLTMAPPPGSGINYSRGVSWAELFSEEPNFPSPPRTQRPLAAMDQGATEVGASWTLKGVVGYEQELQGELARWRQAADASKQRQVIEKLVSFYEAVADWERAIPMLYELRKINLKFKDAVFVADCDLRLGIAFYRLGRWPEAEEVLAQGMAKVELHKSLLYGTKTQLRLQGYLGLVRLRQNDAPGAFRVFDDLVKPLVQQHGSTYVSATFHHRMAIIRSALGNYDAAHAEIGLALSLRIECAAEFEAARSLYVLGQICRRQSRHRAAIAIWRICEVRQFGLKDSYGLARTKLELGDAFGVLAMRREADSDRHEFDVHEADLSEVELAALAHMAQGTNARADEGFRMGVQRAKLSDLALSALNESMHWALQSGNSDAVSAAQASIERLAR